MKAENTGEYAAGREVPLTGYATLATAFGTGAGLFVLGMHRSGRPLPAQVPPWDVLLLGVATYRISRLVTRDKVTSFLRAPFTRRAEGGDAGAVVDEPRGHGLRLAVGTLLACPFCVSGWAAGTLVCGYAAAPRATRLVASGLGAVTVSDWLQYAWSATQARAGE